MKKGLIIIGLLLGIVSAFFVVNGKKELTIDEVLETESYVHLSDNVKKYIKDHYEETGDVYLLKDNAKVGQTYLNPNYIEYLDSEEKDNYSVIPSVIAYTPKIVESNRSYPSKYDLRNVDGKVLVTPNKNQGSEGICWAYATASLLETHDLITKNKNYDNSAILFSEKQMDYALSNDGIIGGNNVIDSVRPLSEGATLSDPLELLIQRIGGYSDTWDSENRTAINNSSKIAPNVVFNRDLAFYEVDETFNLFNINEDLTDTELNDSMRNLIKESIYNYGGTLISIDVDNVFTNVMSQNKDDLKVYKKEGPSLMQHALHLIGWDDNYEYGYCHVELNNVGTDYPLDENIEVSSSSCDYLKTNDGSTVEMISGTGAWILKNSWGDYQPFIYLTYDSYIDQLSVVKSYSEKNWDNNIKLTKKIEYKNGYYNTKFTVDNKTINNDKAVKLKINNDAIGRFDLYFSEDGSENNLVLIENFTFDYTGIKTVDLSNRNINITPNSYFLSYNPYISLYLFKNDDDNLSAYTEDYEYGLDNENPGEDNNIVIDLKTDLKNIQDNETITYKIKDSNSNYLSNSKYDVTYNKSYYSLVTPTIKINKDFAKKGIYSLETWKDDQLLHTSTIDLKVDYVGMNGSGTQSDPWQVTNTRQFNMIRNAPYDNFKLMNDIDFYYDTQNSEGLFYRNGSGWEAIQGFYGNFDGNGKTIKNIKANNGVFENAYSNDDYCFYNKCGIHDLNVDSLITSNNEGGIINYIDYFDTKKYDFSNLSVTNAKFNSIYGIARGCIVGQISVDDTINNSETTALKIDNWYCDATFEGNESQSNENTNNIGGLIGYVAGTSISDGIYLSLNNMKVNITYDLSNDNNKHYYVSDIIGAIDSKTLNLNINNIISNVDIKYNENANVYVNAFVGNVIDTSNGKIRINGVKSTLPYNSNNLINITNYEAGLKPYEIARSNYNSISYYETEYYVYDYAKEGSTQVKFTDKFNTYDNKIPTLKKYPESYSEYYKNYSINVGETKSFNDLISNNGNGKLNVYKSFVCDEDVCNNVTDETIISVNENKFTGLKSGTTTLILYDEISGYLDIVSISVVGDEEYVVTLNNNYNDEVSYINVRNNEPYGTLPQLEREGYTFDGWFSESEGGTEIKSDTIFEGNSNITIYAHWTKINTPVILTVTFDSNGGSNVNSASVESGTPVTKPSDPTREGYTFVEWQLNGNTYDFSTPVTENITLIAKWEKVNTPVILTVTFDSNGGSNVNSSSVESGTPVTKPSDPAREGYIFVEWQLNENTYDFSTPVTANIILVAKWEVVKPQDILAPTLKLSANNNQVTITWNDQDEDKTEIYRSLDNKKWARLSTVTDNSYVDKSLTYGKTYYYKVKVKGNGMWTGYSNVVSKKIAPNKVNNLVIKSAGTNNIKIGYDKVSTTGYEIYRSTDNKNWTKVKTITDNKTLEFNNKDLKANKTYYYKVRAYKSVSGTKIYGSYSAVVSTKTAPAKPSFSVKLKDYNAMNLVIGEAKGATKYIVQKSLDGKIWSALEELTKYGTLVDSGNEIGKTYYYAVKVCNSQNRCSGWVKANLKQTTKTPGFSLKTSSKKVTITMSKVNGASGYQIYRATSKNGKYEKVKEFSSEVELLEFVNKTTKGKTYYYKVRSFALDENNARIYSPYSSVKSITSK